ncbi:hypothetical protein BKA59DRAFT_260709 [Fusarium tricinctum]|uniref:Uncharacterized protein n=2 Tax=Fusarium tricinctum species complex TaxID=679429 RepID=A0A8K0RQX7_9HYPO|nr:hypothetical protein BKA59DRAFT_260709 [Fusarium tricinctum]
MQTSLAPYHHHNLMSDDFYNSWVEPSEYPRIPNVYEPIQDSQVAGLYDTQEKKEPTQANADSRDSRQSYWSGYNVHSSGEQAHKGLVDDLTNYSVVVQLGSNYRSDKHTLSSNLKETSGECQSPRYHADSVERRRARREASFEKWKDAGDKLFCQSGRFRP